MAGTVTNVGSEALLRHFAEIRPAQAVGGNAPILLGNQEDIWLVTSGKIEVFVVSLANGQPTGARRHCLTAVVGDALFGMPATQSDEALGLLAVGAAGTSLIRLNPGELQSAAADESLQPGVIAIVTQWITGLSRDVWKPSRPRPRAEITCLRARIIV